MGNSKINHKNHLDNSVVNVEKLLSIDDAFPIGTESNSVQNEYSELVSFDEAFSPIGNETKPKEQNFVEFSAKNQYNHYVKNDQDALKSVLKARYKLTDEAAEAFSAKLDTAARIQKLRDELEWPPTKIELYEDRKPLPETGKKETAIEFYNRVWLPYSQAWLISQEILKNKFGETKLVPAIRSQCQRDKLEFSANAPPSQNKLNDSLAMLDLGGISEKLLNEHRTRTASNKAALYKNI